VPRAACIEAAEHGGALPEAAPDRAGRVYFQRVEQTYDDTPLVGDAMIGIARCDALAGRTADAIRYLKDLEARFHGEPLGARAARERSRIERMGTVKPAREAHRIPENQP